MFGKKKPTIYGYVKTSDGTEFQIVDRKIDFERQLEKLKTKMEEGGIDAPVSALSLYNNGEYLNPEDVLSVSFVFDEESPERDCINFLRFLGYSSNIASVMSNSKFNNILLSKIISTPSYASDSVIREMVYSQNMFAFKDFIYKLPIDMAVTLFTENPYRTKENMSDYKSIISRLIKNLITENLNGNFMFGYKELDILNKDLELRALFNKMSDEFFDGAFPFKDIVSEIMASLEEKQLEIFQNIDDVQYLISSVKSNTKPYAKDKIITKLKEKNVELENEYKTVEQSIAKLNDSSF